MNDPAHHANDFERLTFLGDDRLITCSLVLRAQPDGVPALVEPFNGKAVIQLGDDNVPVPRLLGEIHHQHVAVPDTGIHHRVALSLYEIGGRGIGDHQLIEVDGFLLVALCGRREASLDGVSVQGSVESGNGCEGNLEHGDCHGYWLWIQYPIRWSVTRFIQIPWDAHGA